jgi:DNA-binding beta-propeller fold protein YncE
MRVYRAADHAVLAELPYGNPEVVAVNDATRAVFMTQSGSGVRVVSADLLQEVFALTEPFTFSGTGIAVNTFNGRIYVADYGSGVLRVYQN